jgi:hypothetical protein
MDETLTGPAKSAQLWPSHLPTPLHLFSLSYRRGPPTGTLFLLSTAPPPPCVRSRRVSRTAAPTRTPTRAPGRTGSCPLGFPCTRNRRHLLLIPPHFLPIMETTIDGHQWHGDDQSFSLPRCPFHSPSLSISRPTEPLLLPTELAHASPLSVLALYSSDRVDARRSFATAPCSQESVEPPRRSPARCRDSHVPLLCSAATLPPSTSPSLRTN